VLRKSFPITPKTLGDYLKVKRYEKGLSLGQLAQITGVEKKWIVQLEHDQRLPDANQLRELESALGCSDSFLPPKSNT
jgi:transcriptional regulator with XRE-family HTH domain